MEGRSAGPEGQGGCFDSPSLGPLDSLPTRNDQGGALDPDAEGRSGRLAEKALYCASEVLRIAFSGRHPPCAPIGMRARFGGRACTRQAQRDRERSPSTHQPKGDHITTNDYFDQEMRVMTPDKVLQPRAFALCWGTAGRLYIFRTAAPSLPPA